MRRRRRRRNVWGDANGPQPCRKVPFKCAVFIIGGGMLTCYSLLHLRAPIHWLIGASPIDWQFQCMRDGAAMHYLSSGPFNMRKATKLPTPLWWCVTFNQFNPHKLCPLFHFKVRLSWRYWQSHIVWSRETLTSAGFALIFFFLHSWHFNFIILMRGATYWLTCPRMHPSVVVNYSFVLIIYVKFPSSLLQIRLIHEVIGIGSSAKVTFREFGLNWGIDALKNTYHWGAEMEVNARNSQVTQRKGLRLHLLILTKSYLLVDRSSYEMCETRHSNVLPLSIAEVTRSASCWCFKKCL